MNLGVLTLVHGRRRLTKLLAHYYTTLRTSHTLVPCAVATFTDTWASDVMPGWSVLYASNDYLSDKWTVGMQAMREYEVDAVLIIGSDDFCDRAFIDDAVAADEPYIMPDGIYFYNTATQQALFRKFFRCGAGRILRADLLEDCEWRPWQARSNVPDAAMNKIVERKSGWYYDRKVCTSGAVMDVKTCTNMWPYSHLEKGDFRRVEGADLLREHFPTVAEELLQWDSYTRRLY